MMWRETIMMRNKVGKVFSTITACSSVVSLRLKQLSSELPLDASPTSALLTKIAATAITGLVLNRLKGRGMREDEDSARM